MGQIDFYKRLAIVGARIPYGRVATYGQIALLCGKPRNARQVGYTLNHHRSGDDFPAYRIVNSQGRLSGARAFAQPDLQRKMLEREGIKVNEEEWVSLKEFGWKHTHTEAEELYNLFIEKKI